MAWPIPRDHAKRLEQLKAGVAFVHRTERNPLIDKDGQQKRDADGNVIWESSTIYTKAIVKSTVDGTMAWESQVEGDGVKGEQAAFDAVMAMIPEDARVPSHGELLRENAELRAKVEAQESNKKADKPAPSGTGK